MTRSLRGPLRRTSSVNPDLPSEVYQWLLDAHGNIDFMEVLLYKSGCVWKTCRLQNL